MKKMIIVITTIAAVGLMVGFSSITVNASGFDLQSHYEKMMAKREQQEKEMWEKMLDELEADGNLTPEAIEAAGEYGKGRIPNHKSTSGGRSGSYPGGNSVATTSGKGWVYSVDELHVIGLLEGEDGYTRPGWYGDID